ncbi:hypothetical protein GUJ93_ZPchr0002g25499 [Zizania palustris]|uniref:Uncharacterized protein n=1 Tax=Zizania palustris TaxID=103762 RepID=A0A8J5V5C8_ZIZPA|nr:hypothetical protein GUJ93_ZPchr0002g25499 [Zizania palustris]
MALRRINFRKRPLLLPRPFSSNSSSDPPFPPPPPQPVDRDASRAPSSPAPNAGEEHNPTASLFQGIRERLMSSPSQPQSSRRIPGSPPRPYGHRPETALSLGDIRRQLESFSRSRAAGGFSPPTSSAGATPSFQDLLMNSSAPTSPQGVNSGTETFSFESIRQTFRNLPSSRQTHQPRQSHSPTPFLSSIPHSIFGKELGEKARHAEGERKKDSGIALTRDYSYEELGKKLGELRPAGSGKDEKDWFSLEELQGRIAKLAELESANDSRLGGQFAVFRNSLKELGSEQRAQDSRKTRSMQGISFFANIGGQTTPGYMHLPPQEELVERYFHPDHMSSEEKMKFELQRVRDEFKMSENDCGSARVQSEYSPFLLELISI